MGCDTKGFVLTKEKDVFKICKIIEKSILNEIRKETGAENLMSVFVKDNNFSFPHFKLYTHGMVGCQFRFKGEERDLSIHTLCDNDYNEVRYGKKVIVSLGAWGESVKIVNFVITALSELGEAYIIHNDCESEWMKI
jgi:hypothetical protein